ncbi:LPP20 family lipoprotein [Pseudoprimorskyibacter insulae]|uniref:Lipoprotein LPP20-like domain-containing protein n=1 Tax=Pseudoprimorskyibacter insulae TaxID=1695997 RepID=A0A2R8AVK4_9RHOB|nr:LPP20 family lipoprotein [Pseudoprimorskyibacter insulae]SPF80058.1 hypothetical protein PRI8871_01860 [Pseudoprimorskyibacter insulae]
MTRLPLIRAGAGLAIVTALGACMSQQAQQALPPAPTPTAKAVAQIKDDVNAMHADSALPPVLAAPKYVPVELKGLGFSQVSAQPGKTLNEKRLMAIRAARLEAMRDLVEQVHGIHLTADTTIRDASVTNDHIRGIVEGELRGARTLRISPKDEDTFTVELALDADTVRYILRAVRMGV